MSYRERTSHARGGAVNAVKTALQAAVFWTVFLHVILDALDGLASARGGPAPFTFAGRRALGWTVLAAASALGLWSATSVAARGEGTPLPLDATNRLVVVGPYAIIRNPMAVAGLAQGLGIGLVRGSWLVLAYVAAGVLAWNAVVRPLEERELERRFGAAYRAYRDSVPCWWPRRSPFRAGA